MFSVKSGCLGSLLGSYVIHGFILFVTVRNSTFIPLFRVSVILDKVMFKIEGPNPTTQIGNSIDQISTVL